MAAGGFLREGVMATIRIPRKQRFVMTGEPWRGYQRCLKFFGERRNIRITYDRGVLEVVTLTYEHERAAHILTLLIGAWVEERRVLVRGGGSTTFSRRDLKRGLESDGCYWISNQARLRGVTRVDLQRDPPPDLVVEIDVTNSSLPRMPIYSALGVQEVWRLQGTNLTIHLLQTDGSYLESPVSQALPPLAPTALTKYLALSGQLDDAAVVGQFRAWVRQLPPPTP
jgi:Uma2 family endonuclease